MKNVNIEKNNLITYFMLFIIFAPSILSRYPLLDTISSLLQNCVLVFFIFKIFGSKIFKLSSLEKRGIIYFSIYIASTFLNKGEMSRVIIDSAKIILACMLLYRLNEKYKDCFLHILKNVLSVYIFINFLSLIFIPNGIYFSFVKQNEWYSQIVRWWVLGGKNTMIFYLIPTNVLCQYFIVNNSKGKKMNLFMIFITILTPLLAKSSTSTITIMVVSLFTFFRKYLLLLKKKTIIKGIVVLYIILSVMLLTNSTQKFDFLAGIFGKDLTFTGRVGVWEQAKDLIKLKPILGYGYLSSTYQQTLFGSVSYVNCHNSLLEILLNGGIVLLFAMINIIKLIIQKMKKIDKHKFILIALTLLSLAIESSFEAFASSKLFWLILFIIFFMCVNDTYEQNSEV